MQKCRNVRYKKQDLKETFNFRNRFLNTKLQENKFGNNKKPGNQRYNKGRDFSNRDNTTEIDYVVWAKMTGWSTVGCDEF